MLKIILPAKGDFLINEEFTLEMGGKNKKKYHIQESDNAYLVKDGIEHVFDQTIPLWLIGFLYQGGYFSTV